MPPRVHSGCMRLYFISFFTVISAAFCFLHSHVPPLLIPLLRSIDAAAAADSTSALTDDVQMQLYLRKILAQAFIFSPFSLCSFTPFFYTTHTRLPKMSQMLLTAQSGITWTLFLSVSLVQPKQLTLCPIRETVRERERERERENLFSFASKEDVFYSFP